MTMAVPSSRDNDHRTIIHFDYDCFYASVIETEQPALKTLPLAIQQKQIIVTCNYEARRRGLHKLQTARDAKMICPDVVIVMGEDLTKFRDASKELYRFLRTLIWGGRVERLGFDELFLDVTDMIEYNVELLNKNDLENSFFHLDRHDPVVGFLFDATKYYGPTYPESESGTGTSVSIPATQLSPDSLPFRLMLASHLARYLRNQLEHQKGYTSSVGVSTSKLLSKLVGSTHKPNNQTTLLPPYTATRKEKDDESNVIKFLDAYEVRKIPGIGSKLAHKLLGSHLFGPCTDSVAPKDYHSSLSDDKRVTIRDLRLFPGMGPSLLDRILGGPRMPKDIGMRIWALIHGVDDSEVTEARDVPTQISVENSFGKLNTMESVRRELVLLSASLIRRMRVDLVEKSATRESTTNPNSHHHHYYCQWLAHPRTLRLSTRPRPRQPEGSRIHDINRVSRSTPLPQFVFGLEENIDALAERLVRDTLLSMFRKIHPERSSWNLSLLNIAVTNMVESAGSGQRSDGRDIGKMFRTQKIMSRKDWKVTEPGFTTNTSTMRYSPEGPFKEEALEALDTTANDADAWEEDDSRDDEDEVGDDDEAMSGVACVTCVTCGASIPHFAQVAHTLYHLAPD